MSQSVTSETSRHGWSRTLGPESLASVVEISSHSVASDTRSRGSRSGLLRAISAPSSGDRVQLFAGPTRHSERSPGGYTHAPKQWVYKARLVDKWGFLAKTVLILERLKDRPSDDVVVEADLQQAPGVQGKSGRSSNNRTLESTGSGPFGDMPPGEPLEAESAAQPATKAMLSGLPIEPAQEAVHEAAAQHVSSHQQLPEDASGGLSASLGAEQAVTPAPTAIVEITDAAADAEAVAPAVAASDVASTRAGDEELQSEGSASTAIKEAMSSLLTKVDQDNMLMSHGSVSNVRESVLIPSVSGSTHVDGNSTDLISGMIVEQPAMTKDESESVMCSEVNTVLDDLTSTAGVAVPVQSADNSSMPDAAVDTDSVKDRLLIDVGGTEHESQDAEQSSVLLLPKGNTDVCDVPTPVGESSPDAMVSAALDTDSLTDILVADTAGGSSSEQQAGLPMAPEVDTDNDTERLFIEVSVDDAKSTQQEEQGSSNPDDVDDLLDDLVTTAAMPLPAHTEMAPVSTSEAETEAEIANAEPEDASAEREPVSAEIQDMGLDGSDRPDVSDRPEQIETESVLEGLVADAAQVPQYMPSSETEQTGLKAKAEHTHAVHDDADIEGDDAVDSAMEEIVTNVSSPAHPIVPLLSLEKQSTDPASTAMAGRGGSFGRGAGMSSEVDGIIEQLMVAMSIGQTVGHSTPAAVAMQLVADVEVTLTQLRDEVDSDPQGPKAAADAHANPLAEAADAETLAETVAEPVQGLVMTADDEDDAQQQQAEGRPAVAEHALSRPSTSEAQARVTADVDSTIAQLSASAIDDSEAESRVSHVIPEHELTFRAAANSPGQMCEAGKPARLTEDVDHPPAELTSFTQLEAPQRAQLVADPSETMAEPSVFDATQTAQTGSGQPSDEEVHQQTKADQSGRLTADIDATLADFSPSVSATPAQQQQDESPVQSSDYWLAVGLHLPKDHHSSSAVSSSAQQRTAESPAQSDESPGQSDESQAGSAEQPAQSDDLHMPTAQHDSARSVRLTEDINDALADLSSSAISSSAQLAADESAEQSVMQSTEEPAAADLQKTGNKSESAQPGRLTEDVDAVLADVSSSTDQQLPQDQANAASGGSTAAEHSYWLAVGLHMPPHGADGVAGPQRMTEDVDVVLANLSSSADQQLPQNHSDAASGGSTAAEHSYWLAVGLHMPVEAAVVAQPQRVTEDVDAALAELWASATQHVKELEQAEPDSQPTRVTSDVDDAVADLMSSAAADSAQQSQLEESEFSQLNTLQLQDTTADVDVTVAELSATAVDHVAQQQQQQPEQQQQQSDVQMHAVINSADHQPARLTADVDETLRDLSDSAATSTGRAQSQEAIARESGQPACITADVDRALQELSSAAVSHAAEAQQQPPVQHETAQSLGQTTDVDVMLDDNASSAKAEMDTAQRVHVTADVDVTLADLSASAISHAAQSPQHAPAASSEEAADAATAADDSYAADPISIGEAVPLPVYASAGEAAEAVAIFDVLLDDTYEADGFEVADEAVSSAFAAAAEVGAAGMPDRPASPVAMQLAMLSPMEEGTAVGVLSDRTAPASLAGDQQDQPTEDDGNGDEVLEADAAVVVETKSEDGLVEAAVAASQEAHEEDVRSEASSTASSDLDAITDADAEAVAEAADEAVDEAYQNGAFDVDAEESELLRDDSAAQDSAAQSSGAEYLQAEDDVAAESPAVAQNSAEQDVVVETAAEPVPPLHRIPSGAAQPGRPSRAFIRHAISLTQPDSDNSPAPALPLAAAPSLPTPQAPAGPPPRHRSRQHAPLMHQASQSGQGSLGQPARIEAFWPSPANSRPPSHASPHRPPPRAGSQGRKKQHQKRAVGNSPRAGRRAAGDSLKADLGLEGSDMVDLQELGRPLKGPTGVVLETKSPAGLQLTRHLEYDILQCIAKDRPEHLSWLVVKAREMGVRPTNSAVAAATTICRLTRRQAVSKAPPLLTEELQGMRASLMGLDKIYHHHGIMPGAVRSSPVFDNASRALQRLTLDNEAAAAVATADWQAMEQVLEVARKQNNQVVAHRMEVALDRLEVEASGSPSARSVRSSRALEGAVRLRDLASPVRPRSMHGPRAPSPGRGQVPEDVVRRLEEHDDQQAAVHLAWLAQKDEQRRRHEAKVAVKKNRRLPQWYLHTAALRPRIDSQDFAAWRESHADVLEEKTADQMSMMYIQTVEAELRKFRLEYMNRYNYARELNWQGDHTHMKRQLFDDTLEKQPSNVVVSMPYATNSSRAYL